MITAKGAQSHTKYALGTGHSLLCEMGIDDDIFEHWGQQNIDQLIEEGKKLVIRPEARNRVQRVGHGRSQTEIAVPAFGERVVVLRWPLPSWGLVMCLPRGV